MVTDCDVIIQCVEELRGVVLDSKQLDLIVAHVHDLDADRQIEEADLAALKAYALALEKRCNILWGDGRTDDMAVDDPGIAIARAEHPRAAALLGEDG